MLLNHLVQIASGLQVSSLTEADYQPVPKPVQLLQLSDFSSYGQPLPPFRNQLTSLPPAAEKHMLRPGQVLLTAKGARLFGPSAMTSLRQARNQGKLDQFAKAHDADAPGDEAAFNATLESMAGKSKADQEASKPGRSDD